MTEKDKNSSGSIQTKTQPPKGQGNLVWLDLEMTGLDPRCDSIIEIAVLITNAELDVIAKGPQIVIHQPSDRFAQMDDWNREHHVKSGLWGKVLESTWNIEMAEKEVLNFLRQHFAPKVSPLCGNSIWQDRRFLVQHMPELESFFHYRLIDVSTLKELASRWFGESARFTKEKGSHRAMDDIIESVEELKFYRRILFKENIDL